MENVKSYKLLRLRFFKLNKRIKIKHKLEGLKTNVKLPDLHKDQQRLYNLKKREAIILK